MSRTFTLIGCNNVLSNDFYPPIELDVNSSYGIGLIGFYSYNSIFNVDEKNNKIVLKNPSVVSVTIQIPPGSYEIDEINSAIQKEIKNNIDHNPNQNIDAIFCLRANNNTLKCELRSIYDIDFTRSDTLNELLGFENVILEANKIHQSSLPVNIMKVRLIRINCNLISGAYINGKEDHTLFEFDIDVEPGYKLTKEPQNVIYMSVKPDGRQFIHNITVRILDELGCPVNFRGEQIIVRLELKQL